jgi:hypothetical protein|tara:strand:- start:50 stop:799 length:750 start_codon:yes stop_codon:yes gene_type:complete
LQQEILAVLLAVLPASLGYWAKVRTESLACRRLVLSYLLEIRHTLMCTSLTADKLSKGFDSALEKIFAKYRQVDDELIIDEALGKLRPIAYKMFNDTVCGMLPSFDDAFLAEFNSTLREFRKEEPLLAFQLKGWEKEQTYLQIKQDYANTFSNLDEMQGATSFKQFLEKTLTEDEDKSLIESVRLLDGLISKIARSSGILTFVKISFYLYKRPVVAFSVNEADFLNEMSPILDKLDELIEQHLANNHDR